MSGETKSERLRYIVLGGARDGIILFAAVSIVEAVFR